MIGVYTSLTVRNEICVTVGCTNHL